MQKVGRIIEVIARINKRLADRIFIGHGGNGRDFGNQATAGNGALLGIIDVSAVVIKRGQRANDADHNGHWVRIAAETVEETVHLLVQHGVAGNRRFKLFELCGTGQLAIQQQKAGLDKAAFIGQLLDGIAAVQQYAFFAINVGDGRFTTRRGGETGVISELACLTVKRRYINDARPYCSFMNAEFIVFSKAGEFSVLVAHCGLLIAAVEMLAIS